MFHVRIIWGMKKNSTAASGSHFGSKSASYLFSCFTYVDNFTLLLYATQKSYGYKFDYHYKLISDYIPHDKFVPFYF